MSKVILLIGAGQWILDWCEYFHVDYVLIQKPELYQPACAKEVILMDYDHDPAIWEYIDTICKNRNVIACLTATEPALVLAEEIAEKYNLPYRTCKNVHLIKNKYQMRQALSSFDRYTIPYKYIVKPDDVYEFLEIHRDIIVKPVDGVGSRNIVKLSREDHNAVARLTDFPLLAERFISGQEYSVEVFSFHGQHLILGVTEKQIDAQTFVEKCHVFPAAVPTPVLSRIAAFVRSFLDDIGIMNGPSHTEIKMEDDNLYVIETHNRVGGDSIAHLVEMTTGFNLFKYMIGWPAGFITDTDFSVTYNGAAAIYFLFSTDGCVKFITGVDSSKTIPGITNLSIYKKVGDAVEQTTSSFNRLGQIIAHADSRQSCLQAFDKVCERLKIVIQ